MHLESSCTVCSLAIDIDPLSLLMSRRGLQASLLGQRPHARKEDETIWAAHSVDSFMIKLTGEPSSDPGQAEQRHNEKKVFTVTFSGTAVLFSWSWKVPPNVMLESSPLCHGINSHSVVCGKHFTAIGHGGCMRQEPAHNSLR